MKETGIIFSGNHPKLILDGIKTMTRRVIKPQPVIKGFINNYGELAWYWKGGKALLRATYGADYVHTSKNSLIDAMLACCPYGQVGDRLWVKETTWRGLPISPIYDADLKDAERADYWDMGCRKVPSLFMPKRTSRITLEITSLRAERLQEISAGDCTSEGIPYEDGDYVAMKVFDKFRDLWDSLNAKRGYGWDTNCWVWVIGFKVIRQLINYL